VLFFSGEATMMSDEQTPTPGGDAACGLAPSDHSLLRRFRGGSQDAATQLYVRYAHRLRALVKARCSTELARRVEPEDIVQSVFRRFFRRVSQGDYDVPAGEELWGLFLVIALNRIRAAETFHRAGKRDVRVTVPDSPGAALEAATGHDEAAYTVLQMTIEEALANLQPQQRQMLELRVQGCEVAEIAKQTGRSKRTVERNLQAIRAWLRTYLDREKDDATPSAPA
jgi:RNA polymerase sigma-70 factor (ECF subfamily)